MATERPRADRRDRPARGRGRPPYPDVLTPAEWRVLDLLREGLSNPEIADRLALGRETVKTHVAAILSKLGVATREEAAAWQPAPTPRPWWAAALAWLRPVTLGKAALITAAVTVLAGLGLLAWGVLRDPGEESALVVAASQTPTRRPTPTDPAAPFLSPTARPTPVYSPAPLGRLIEPVDGLSSSASQYLVDVVSGQLFAVPRLGVWSPDGSKMAISNCCLGGGLVVMDMASGEAVRLVGGDIGALDWSPDGDHVAFTFSASADGPHGLFVISLTDAGMSRLADVPPSWTVDWSPDGSTILVSRGMGDASLVDVDSGEIEVVARPADAVWLPSGATLVWANEDGVFLRDVHKGDERQIASGPASGGIHVSPDGSMVVMPFGEPVATFVPPPEGAVSLRYVFHLTGAREAVPLPPGFSLNWSPDSQQIAYVSYGCVTEEWDIYTISADGDEPQRITSAPDVVKEGAAWSPDGRWLAYSTIGEVRLVEVETGTERVLVSSPSERIDLHFHGMWSPDGQYIAFVGPGGHGICT